MSPGTGTAPPGAARRITATEWHLVYLNNTAFLIEGLSMKNTSKLMFALVLGALAGPALAGGTVTVSEPTTLSLLGLAGVVAAVIAIRKRRK